MNFEDYSSHYNDIQRFKEDALDKVGLKGHPKADHAFSQAWENGHTYGFVEVFSHLEDLASLLLD